MKFSACTAAFGMADLKKIIDTSAKLGYDAVELTAALHLPVESTPERRKEILGWIHELFAAPFTIFSTEPFGF